MRHLKFNIDDPRWAIAIAGTIRNAQEGAYIKLNVPFTVSFKSSNPLIQYLADYFDPIDEDSPDYMMPSQEQYHLLDYYSAAIVSKNLQEQHGIKQEPNVVPLFIHALSYNMLLMTHAIASAPGYYFPKFSKSALEGVEATDALVESMDLVPGAISFCTGMGIENPVIKCIEGLNDLEVAKLYFRTKLIMTKPNHLLQYIARSQYKGFDFLSENIPVLSVIDRTVTPDDRYLVSWSGQIPYFVGQSDVETLEKGKAYKIRKSYNFDHREYYRDFSKGKIKS